MRQRAIQRGLRLNEYGLFKSKEETRDPKLLVPCQTEEEIFAAAGPGLCAAGTARGSWGICRRRKTALAALARMDRSERRACTTTQLERRPRHARRNRRLMEELGFAYWAITDHSKSSFQANGLDAERLRQQIKEIKELNENMRGARQ